MTTVSPWSNKQSFASVAARAAGSEAEVKPSHANKPPSPSGAPRTRSKSRERQRPSTPEEEPVYVLTLTTDQKLHKQMTQLRDRHFPRRLNKLEAHLTLFHALPHSHLTDSISTRLQELANRTESFEIEASRPFRLRKGIGISIARQRGGARAEELHRELRDAWRREDFLSDQDAGNIRLHYTIMNKVDDETKVEETFQQLEKGWRPRTGLANGFGLWLYDRGYWKWQKAFLFQNSSDERTK